LKTWLAAYTKLHLQSMPLNHRHCEAATAKCNCKLSRDGGSNEESEGGAFSDCSRCWTRWVEHVAWDMVTNYTEFVFFTRLVGHALEMWFNGFDW